jgi:hypothetical protein
MSSPELAAAMPGSDPTPVISAGEQRLADFLAMPTRQLLDHMGLPGSPSPAVAMPATPGAPAHHNGATNPFDPMQLISPVAQALSMLGSGGFPGMDPTSMLNGITNAVDGTSGPLQQALGAVGQGWQGASSTAAAAKTSAALANGADVAKQATALQHSLTVAAADVAQARTQLIEIINEYMATLTASIPGLPFTLPTIVSAASKAVTHTTQVMTQTQSSLAAQASAVSAAGTPVNVTSAPQLGGALGGLGSMLGLGSGAAGSATGAASSAASPMSALSAASPLMYLGMAGISPALSAATAAGRGGNPAATDTATLADATAKDPKLATAAAPLKAGAAAPIAHAGGGAATAPSAAPMPRLAAPMTPAPETSMLSSPTRPAMTGGTPMGGAGMMGGAPLGGASNAASAGGSGAHTAASFLHTSDQGGKVVGGRTTVAPPVLGEADPYELPDIELRI